MSRPRTPLKVLEARGSIAKNPQRYRERLAAAAAAPKTKLGPPPEKWDVPPESMGALKYARWKAIWNEFATLVPNASPVKRITLELLCEMLDRFRLSPASVKTSERALIVQLIKQLESDEGVSSGRKNPEGYGGQWEAFG
jgi:hypothetical protein